MYFKCMVRIFEQINIYTKYNVDVSMVWTRPPPPPQEEVHAILSHFSSRVARARAIECQAKGCDSS